jgi:hypothetical protein
MRASILALIVSFIPALLDSDGEGSGLARRPSRRPITTSAMAPMAANADRRPRAQRAVESVHRITGQSSLNVEIVVEPPVRADEEMLVGTTRNSRRIFVSRAAATPARAALENGAVVYHNASPGVDALLYPEGNSVEEMLVVHDARAVIGYRIDVPQGSTLIAASPSLIEVRDEQRSAWLRFRVDAAWDRSGNNVPVRVVLTGHQISLLVDEHAVLPVWIDPAWQATSSMTTPRYRHRATLLSSGKVLFTGGWPCIKLDCNALKSAEIFDPAGNGGEGSFTLVPHDMQEARAVHAATKLPSGKVRGCPESCRN